MPNRSVSKVRRSICLLLLALLFVSWGIFALSTIRDYRAVSRQCGRHLQSIAFSFEMQTRHVVELVDSLMLEMRQHYFHHSAIGMNELFRGWLLRFPALASLSIVDSESQEILFFLSNRADVEHSITEAAAFFTPAGDRLDIAGKLFFDAGGARQLALSRSFKTGEHRLRVIALLYTDFFLRFQRDTELGPDGTVALFHREGMLLARNPQAEQMPGQFFVEPDLLEKMLLKGSIGLSLESQQADGFRRMIAHRALSELPLVVTVGTSSNWIFSDWQKRFLDYLLLQIIVSGTIIVSALILFRTLSRVEKVEIDLKERKEHFQAVANSSVEAVISVDEDEHIRFWSAGAELTFGCDRDEALDMPITCFLQFAENDRPLTLKQLADENSAWAAEKVHEVQGQRKDGELFPTELSLSRTVVSGRPFYTLIVRDISERRQMEERAKRQASHDSLTDLPNRTLLLDRLHVAMAQIRRHGGQFALLYIDLDEFKPVNDTFGHDAGDRLLQQVAKRMQKAVRESDTVARLGGDEFAVLLQNIEDADAVKRGCEHLLATLRQVFSIAEQQVQISCSIGAVLYQGQQQSTSDLIGLADNAMYEAKRNGKNRFVISQN